MTLASAPACTAFPARLRRCESGVSVVEFALAMPIVIGLLLLLFEIGFVLTGGIFLDAGARSASRFGITGAIPSGQTREERVREIITRSVCPRSIAGSGSGLCFWTTESVPIESLADGSPLQIDMRAYTDPRNVGIPEPYSDLPPENGQFDAGEPYTDVNGNGQWDADMGLSNSGGAEDVVVYDVRMPQALVTPFLRMAMGDEVIWHTSRVVVRNEPF